MKGGQGTKTEESDIENNKGLKLNELNCILDILIKNKKNSHLANSP